MPKVCTKRTPRKPAKYFTKGGAMKLPLTFVKQWGKLVKRATRLKQQRDKLRCVVYSQEVVILSEKFYALIEDITHCPRLAILRHASDQMRELTNSAILGLAESMPATLIKKGSDFHHYVRLLEKKRYAKTKRFAKVAGFVQEYPHTFHAVPSLVDALQHSMDLRDAYKFCESLTPTEVDKANQYVLLSVTSDLDDAVKGVGNAKYERLRDPLVLKIFNKMYP